MDIPLLQTKLYPPPARPGLVPRPRLVERLNAGIRSGKLTLLSAPAGFGKTTLVSEWIAAHRGGGPRLERRGTDACPRGRGPAVIPPVDGATPSLRVAWLSLDENDNDPTRFLTYLIASLQAALQAVEAKVGKGVLTVLYGSQPQPPPTEAILTTLINEISALPDPQVLILDDYHLIEAQPIHDALTFLLEHLPPPAVGPLGGLHLVLSTREDPPLPLSRLRARGQLVELRAADMRFTPAEAAEFLNQVMGLDLSAQDVAALETRTEGWIAGLQLAALALQGPPQGHKDVTGFVRSFTGSHRFVLDYLVEEVLDQQPENVQEFLLRTAILDRLTGSLCDAVCLCTAETPKDGQATLEMLERANLFIIPLDGERRWYRYHHLFADLLRQRLHRRAAASAGDGEAKIAELHRRASVWYEENGLEIEAFHHAAAAHDVERAERLVEGGGMPLYFRGALAPILNWLESLSVAVLDAHPSLWVTYAMTLLAIGRTAEVEEKLRAAERAIEAAAERAAAGAGLDGQTRDLIGRIANTRANLAVGHRQVETILAQSRRALEYLHPDNLTFRTAVAWKMGVAYEFQGDRAAASQAFAQAIAASEASGNTYVQILATTGLGNLQLAENQLYLAAETYRRVLQLVGDLLIPVGCHVHLCLARIYYEWNDFDAAQQHGQQALQLAEPYKDDYDIYVVCELFLARLARAQGDPTGAAALLARAEQSVRQHNFVHQIPQVAAAQVHTLLGRGELKAAADLAQAYEHSLLPARVCLAQGDIDQAIALLEPLRQEVEAKGWQDERLKVMLLQALALHALAAQKRGKEEQAMQLLGETLALAEPGGLVRTFLDEGPSMARLLYEGLSRGIAGHGSAAQYVGRLLAAFPAAEPEQAVAPRPPAPERGLIEPLSEREREVLQLIAEGLTNPEIAARLYLSLNTIKAHSRNIYGKLGVHNRTQAIARARALGLLSSN